MKLTFGVVTRVPNAEAGEPGNLAIALPLFVQPGPMPDYVVNAAPYLGALVLALRAPVFELGEILVLDSDGREVSGRRRKPSKWDISLVQFDTIEEAADAAAAIP